MDDETKTAARAWAPLKEHLNQHARLVNHFRHLGPTPVLRMWRIRQNEKGRTSLTI